QLGNEVLSVVRRLVLCVVDQALRVTLPSRHGRERGGAALLLDAGPCEREVVLEDAAGVGDIPVEVRGGRGSGDGAEVRWLLAGGQQLRDASEADADHPNPPVGPWLARRPFHGVVTVLAHRVVERVELPLRASGAAYRNAQQRVAAAHQPVRVGGETVIG